MPFRFFHLISGNVYQSLLSGVAGSDQRERKKKKKTNRRIIIIVIITVGSVAVHYASSNIMAPETRQTPTSNSGRINAQRLTSRNNTQSSHPRADGNRWCKSHCRKNTRRVCVKKKQSILSREEQTIALRYDTAASASG